MVSRQTLMYDADDITVVDVRVPQVPSPKVTKQAELDASKRLMSAAGKRMAMAKDLFWDSFKEFCSNLGRYITVKVAR